MDGTEIPGGGARPGEGGHGEDSGGGGVARRGIRGLLIDLDGTVYQDDAALPGVPAALAALRDRGAPYRFVTNTTRVSRDALVERLRGLGIAAGAEDVFTAPRAAAAWLRENGIRRVALLLPPEGTLDFREFETDEDAPEAVVVGDLAETWSFERLNRGLRWLLAGARLVAIQKNRYWHRRGQLVLDAGPFVAALEYAAGVEAVVVGKPEPMFFRAAAASMGLDPGRVAMVGDDVESDIGGAQRAGALGILVRTGKFRPDAVARAGVRPDLILDSLADLPGVLRD